MAITNRVVNRRDFKHERKERDWAAFFADDAPSQENTWEESVAKITRRLARRVKAAE